MIAKAADRHRDLVCRLGLHLTVRYPRALGVERGKQVVTDDTFCKNCHRLLRRRVVAVFEYGAEAPHLLGAQGIAGVDFRSGSTKIPPRS